MKRAFSPRCGSVLVVTVMSLLVLAILSGQILTKVTRRSQTAMRSAAWNDALTTAAAGVDMTIADVSALVPDVRVNTQEGLAVATSPLPTNIISALGISTTGASLASGLTLTYDPAALHRAGEGGDLQQAKIFIDVLPLSSILSSTTLSLNSVTGLLTNPLGLLNGGTDLQLLRIRSRGTVVMGGTRRADSDGLDAKLRRLSLVWDRVNNRKATSPSVSREVEVLLRPVLPFQAALTTSGQMNLSSPDSRVDSFNSTLPLASTNGLYDVSKSLAHGTVIAGSASVSLAGTIKGDVRTSGGAIQASAKISGTVNNGYAQPQTQLAVPSWINTAPSPSPLFGTTTLAAGLAGVPTRYRFTSIAGPLRVTRGLLNLGTDIEIYVSGDVTGSVQIDAGVRAKIYLGGSLRASAGKLSNGSKLAANLQIYGVGDDPADSLRGIELELGAVQAAIYAPLHQVVLTGDGDFMGSITAASLTALEGVKLHFDEALGLNVGPVLRFGVASWLERQL